MKACVRDIVENTIPLLFRKPSDEVQKKVRKTMCEDAIVYSAEWNYDPLEDRRRKMCKCVCTACGEEAYFELAHFSATQCEKYNIGFYYPETNEKIREYERCACPMCGVRVQALRKSKIRGFNRLCTRYVAEAQNINGVFCLSAWWVEKVCDKDGRVRFIFNQNEGFMVVDKTPIRYNGNSAGSYGKDKGTGWFYKEKWDCLFGKWLLSEIEGLKLSIVGSSIEKSALDIFLSENETYPSEYISSWLKYPQIENLVRCGLGEFVREIIHTSCYRGAYYYHNSTFHTKDFEKYINKKKFKPHEILMCQKNEIKDILGVNCEAVAFRKELIDKLGFTMSFSDAHEACKKGGDILIKLFTGEYGYRYPIKRTLNYLEKQIEKRRRGGAYKYDGIVDARYYRDYIEMLSYVHGTVPEELRFPKDLVKAHNRIDKIKKEKVSDELNDKIRTFGEELSYMSFVDEELGLMIRPAMSHKELIDEGKKLSHCVATYANRVGERSTTIFFIRHIDKMDEPFFTLEFNLKNQYVVQNRGKRNCSRPEDVQKFEEKWLKYIKTIKQKGNKNEQRSRSKAEQCAGA